MKLRSVNHLSQPLVKVTSQRTTRRIDVDSMPIRQKENIDKFPRHSDTLFQYNFDGQKIDVTSTYLLQCNFDERKIDVVSIYFVRRNFDEQNISVVSMYFF